VRNEKAYNKDIDLLGDNSIETLSKTMVLGVAQAKEDIK